MRSVHIHFPCSSVSLVLFFVSDDDQKAKNRLILNRLCRQGHFLRQGFAQNLFVSD